jgi:hypothetical protein
MTVDANNRVSKCVYISKDVVNIYHYALSVSHCQDTTAQQKHH